MANESYTFHGEETGAMPPEKQEQQQQSGERPEWLPEQFKSPEEMAQAWKETQGNYTKARQELSELKGEQPEDAEGEPEGKPEGEINAGNLDDAAQKITEQAGVDVSDYTAEYQTQGDLSPESRDKLAESLQGVLGENARELIDDYVEAKKIVHQNNGNLFMQEAGGAEQYQEMTQWAAQNMAPEEVAAYNKAVESGDRHTTIFAIRGLRAQYEAAEGRAPHLMGGQGSAGVSPFQSAAEMRMAMKDDRYKQDPAYREQVQRRLAISDNF